MTLKILYISPENTVGTLNAWKQIHEDKGNKCTFVTLYQAKNNYSSDIKTDGDGEYKCFFKVENLKLFDGDYDVKISSKNISHFKNDKSNIEYWIALEPESTYSE